MLSWKDERIRNSGSFYALSGDMFKAADFMHRKAGVVHHDVKPENALVTGDADGNLVCRLADFGCCKEIGVDTGYRGSPGYRKMAIVTASYQMLGIYFVIHFLTFCM